MQHTYTYTPPEGRVDHLTVSLISQIQRQVAGIEPGPYDHETSTDPLCHRADKYIVILLLEKKNSICVYQRTAHFNIKLPGKSTNFSRYPMHMEAIVKVFFKVQFHCDIFVGIFRYNDSFYDFFKHTHFVAKVYLTSYSTLKFLLISYISRLLRHLPRVHACAHNHTQPRANACICAQTHVQVHKCTHSRTNARTRVKSTHSRANAHTHMPPYVFGLL